MAAEYRQLIDQLRRQRSPDLRIPPRPCAGAVSCTLPINSPWFSSRFSTLIFAPRAVNTSSSVARVGFMPNWSNTRLDSGNNAAAQRKNAA